MVTKKPKGLGLGLEALLGPKVQDEPAVVVAAAPAPVAPVVPERPNTLKLSQLQTGKYQPRTRMDEGGRSRRRHGAD